jgi:hypothetical protein
LLGIFLDPEDDGDMFLWNIAWLSMDYTALYPRREISSKTEHDYSFIFKNTSFLNCRGCQPGLNVLSWYTDHSCIISQVSDTQCNPKRTVLYHPVVIAFMPVTQLDFRYQSTASCCRRSN